MPDTFFVLALLLVILLFAGFIFARKILRSNGDKNGWHEQPSPVALLIVIGLSIFISELLVMFFLAMIPKVGEVAEAFIDSTTLVLLISPVLYSLIFRPLIRQIEERQKVAEVLSESEERYKALFEFNLDAVLLISIDGRVLSANPAAISLSGYPEDELIKMNIHDLLPPTEVQSAERVLRSSAEGLQQSFETTLFPKSGFIIEVEIKTVPMFIKNEVHGIFLVAKDVTQQNKVAATLRKSQRSIEAAGECIIMTDTDGTIQYVNPAFTTLTGYTAKEAVGNDPRILKSGKHNKAFFKEMWDTILISGVWKGEITNKRADGTLFESSMVIAPVILPDGKIDGFVAIHHDISERKRREAELNTAKEKAENATKLKDKFVSLVSHDLRGPLTTILGYLKIVRDDSSLSLPQRVTKYLNNALHSGENMIALIEDLLSISRLNTGRIEPRLSFISMGRITSKTIEQLKYQTDEKGVSLYNELGENLMVYADSVLLGEVMHNLLLNALKFSKSGDSITIKPHPIDHYIVVIEDTGVGIEPEKIADLFKYETKTSSVGTSGEVGTGFGLPLCYDIMQAHGGGLKIESEFGQGTTVQLELPKTKPSVLVVDDDADSLKLLERSLAKFDGNLITAGNGEEALNIVANEKIHLVVTDLVMPKMDGFELMIRLRTKKEFSQTPIIAISSNSDIENKEKALQCGAVDFIDKEEIKKELKNKIEKYLK